MCTHVLECVRIGTCLYNFAHIQCNSLIWLRILCQFPNSIKFPSGIGAFYHSAVYFETSLGSLYTLTCLQIAWDNHHMLDTASEKGHESIVLKLEWAESTLVAVCISLWSLPKVGLFLVLFSFTWELNLRTTVRKQLKLLPYSLMPYFFLILLKCFLL